MPSIMRPGRARRFTKCWSAGSRRMNAIRRSLADARRAMIEDDAIHPMLRALWAPRLMEAIDWIAEEMAADRAEGATADCSPREFGEAEVAGVTLYGKVDRIDRLPDGKLAIVDYKTGQAPGPEGRCGRVSRCSSACCR